MSLPKWMLNRRITNDSDLIVFNAQLHKGLTIAVEALEQSRHPSAHIIQDKALRRIAELGGESEKKNV